MIVQLPCGTVQQFQSCSNTKSSRTSWNEGCTEGSFLMARKPPPAFFLEEEEGFITFDAYVLPYQSQAAQ